MLDFTLKANKSLLSSLIEKRYNFKPVIDFLNHPEGKTIILRHDVEANYPNALNLARIEKETGIRGTFYFRILPNHFSSSIIRDIASMGHEIGYHYDDLSYCHGNYDKAIERFSANLEMLRKIAPVDTICMEGAPLSKWDNRNLWKIYHYGDFGIKCEPYFDIDFSKVLYLTDTGRRWDGKGSVRDKVGSQQSAVSGLDANSTGTIGTIGTPRTSGTDNQEPGTRNQELKFRCTDDIIRAAKAGQLPDQIMITFHPQRWTDKPLPWIQELVMQNVKNVAKRLIIKTVGR